MKQTQIYSILLMLIAGLLIFMPILFSKEGLCMLNDNTNLHLGEENCRHKNGKWTNWWENK
jgi:hypothetical protein